MPHDDGTKHFIVVIGVMILTKDGQTFSRRNFYRSAGRFDLTGQQLEKRGFSGTIGANNPIAVSRSKFEVYILIKDALAKLQRHIIRRNHNIHIPFCLCKLCRKTRQRFFTLSASPEKCLKYSARKYIRERPNAR